MMDEKDLAKLIHSAIEERLRERGRVNILIAGKTGVGKSTLVNEVFQGNLAATGQGRPVTTHTREVSKEGIPVSIFDTRGLEMLKFEVTSRELTDLIAGRKKESDPNRHIHVAWLCISEDSRRVEEAESALGEALAVHVPTIAVITKSRADAGFRDEAIRLIPHARNVIRVRALREKFDDGHVIEPMGLEDLVEATIEIVPEGHRNAFAAAQKVSLRQKVNRAHGVVALSATSAGAVGAVPIPFADAAVLVPIQVSMLAGISVAFGIPVTKAFLATLVSGTLTGAGATLTGRFIAGSLAKFIPGAGSMIAAGTAATITTLFGEAYISTLYVLLKKHPEGLPTSDEIAETFKEQLSLRRKKGKKALDELDGGTDGS